MTWQAVIAGLLKVFSSFIFTWHAYVRVKSLIALTPGVKFCPEVWEEVAIWRAKYNSKRATYNSDEYVTFYKISHK